MLKMVSGYRTDTVVRKELIGIKHFAQERLHAMSAEQRKQSTLPPVDNNVSEREIKRVVLNRKNSLFVGNPRGGRTASILASLTSSCRRHDIDPQLYLTQLLVNLPSAPISELFAWLPDQWKLRQAARTPTG
jgi:hypothetical protein